MIQKKKKEDKMRRKLVFLSIILALVVAACAPTPAPAPAPAPSGQPEEEFEIKMTPDGVKYIVDPKKLIGGGPPKDGIPSIDNPKFVSVEEADQWIEDNELVLAIIYKGVKRVYPLQILVWHEIVNDTIAGDPILVSY